MVVERRTSTVGRLLVVIAEGVDLSTGEDGRFNFLVIALIWCEISCMSKCAETVPVLFSFVLTVRVAACYMKVTYSISVI